MTERITLLFTPEEGREIIYGDHSDFRVISKTITGKSRWNLEMCAIVQCKSDGLYFKANYNVGATENQETRPFDWEDKAEFIQVFKVTKTVEVFE